MLALSVIEHSVVDQIVRVRTRVGRIDHNSEYIQVLGTKFHGRKAAGKHDGQEAGEAEQESNMNNGMNRKIMIPVVAIW